MKRIILATLLLLAKPFLGTGIIDKHVPFLIPLFLKVYSRFQGNTIKTVTIQHNLQLQVYTKDIGVGLPLLLNHKYEAQETALFLSSVHPGETIVDIGAHVGYYALLASYATGTKGKVLAFEPDRESASLLEENLKLNDMKNVLLIEKAVAAKTGEIGFMEQTYNKGESSVTSSTTSGAKTIQAVSLDDYAKHHKIKQIDILKMDIEGVEIPALQGARNLIAASHGLRLFIEYNPSAMKRHGFTHEEFFTLLEDCEFTIHTIIDEASGKLWPYDEPTLTHVMRHTTFCNLFCTKE